MLFKYILILLSFFHLYGNGTTLKEPTFFHNMLAGSYFQFFSFSGKNATPKHTYTFLNEHFKTQPLWTKKEVKAKNSFIFSYFLRTKENDCSADIVLLPFQKNDEFYFLSFDKRFHASNNKESICRLTTCFIDALCKTYPVSLQLHCLLVTSCFSENNFLNFYMSNALAKGHCVYLLINAEEGKCTSSLTAEPAFLRGNYYLPPLKTDSKKSLVVPMFHQITNGCDCVRFSIIYLLYAINGVNPDSLSNMEVREGFKKWIEGQGGFISIEESYDMSVMGIIGRIWRKMMDVMLWVPLLTETMFITGSTFIVYYLFFNSVENNKTYLEY